MGRSRGERKDSIKPRTPDFCRKLLKEPKTVKTCFCLGGEITEFGEWRAKVEVTPLGTHLKRAFFAADCARLQGATAKSVTDAKSRNDVVSRRARKETIQKLATNEDFCHLQGADDYIHSYREAKRTRMRCASLELQQRRVTSCKVPVADFVSRCTVSEQPRNGPTLPHMSNIVLDGGALISRITPPEQVGAQLYVDPGWFPVGGILHRKPPAPKERIIVRNSRGEDGRPLALVEFVRLKSRGGRPYSGRLLSARVQSASKPVVPPDIRELSKKLLSATISLSHGKTTPPELRSSESKSDRGEESPTISAHHRVPPILSLNHKCSILQCDSTVMGSDSNPEATDSHSSTPRVVNQCLQILSTPNYSRSPSYLTKRMLSTKLSLTSEGSFPKPTTQEHNGSGSSTEFTVRFDTNVKVRGVEMDLNGEDGVIPASSVTKYRFTLHSPESTLAQRSDASQLSVGMGADSKPPIARSMRCFLRSQSRRRVQYKKQFLRISDEKTTTVPTPETPRMVLKGGQKPILDFLPKLNCALDNDHIQNDLLELYAE